MNITCKTVVAGYMRRIQINYYDSLTVFNTCNLLKWIVQFVCQKLEIRISSNFILLMKKFTLFSHTGAVYYKARTKLLICGDCRKVTVTWN